MTPDPALVSQQTAAQVSKSVVDLCRSPAGPRDRQLIYGDTLRILSAQDDWPYVQADKDGYCGYVAAGTLTKPVDATHQVNTPATHAYRDPDFKSPDLMSLTFGSCVLVSDQIGRFAQTPLGYIPLGHLCPSPLTLDDPAAVAVVFLGTPYLWGGNSRWGIDCSGLIQAALLACGIPCPGDSDMQMTLGEEATGSYRRNDLLFWKGHVALVTGPDMLIHANASAMATVYEPITTAIERIAGQGDGPVTAHRRL